MSKQIITQLNTEALIFFFFFRDAIDAKRSFITKITNAFDKVKAIIVEIKNHDDRNVPGEMEKIKLANDRLMEQQKQIMIDRNALTKRIDCLKDEIAKQEVRIVFGS